MQVYDQFSGQLVAKELCTLVMVEHIPGMVILGYTTKTDNLVEILVQGLYGIAHYLGDYDSLKSILVYSVYRGYYISTVDFPRDKLLIEQYVKGNGDYPYSFSRKYEAVNNFDLFKGKQRIITPETFSLSKYIPYTFGLEFETSMGYVPENICFRDGLIPLRDGSISGLEYSTVILQGDDGFSLLRQQLKSLRKYTSFNKECSLHVHLGGFKLDPNVLFRIYRICHTLESSIAKLVPAYTFNSAVYKENGKDYCKSLRDYDSFDGMYQRLVGRPFFGSLTQPHPNDIDRDAKWHIGTRYYWVNFINALCYNTNKTIEFRFLRPSYNFEKIITWIGIFSSILKYAESNQPINCNISLTKLLLYAYPSDVSAYLLEGVNKLSVIVTNQSINGDSIGRDISFESEIFKEE